MSSKEVLDSSLAKVYNLKVVVWVIKVNSYVLLYSSCLLESPQSIPPACEIIFFQALV